MADREIFAALDGKFRIVATLRPRPDDHRMRTHYDVEIDDDQLLRPVTVTLTRNHLVALHYALTTELARQAMRDHGLTHHRSVFQGPVDDL